MGHRLRYYVELVRDAPMMGAFVLAWLMGVGYIAWSFIR